MPRGRNPRRGKGVNDLGPTGAAAIAEPEALKSGTTALTALDLQYNDMGEEGELMLQSAIDGRSGFDLML